MPIVSPRNVYLGIWSVDVQLTVNQTRSVTSSRRVRRLAEAIESDLLRLNAEVVDHLNTPININDGPQESLATTRQTSQSRQSHCHKVRKSLAHYYGSEQAVKDSRTLRLALADTTSRACKRSAGHLSKQRAALTHDWPIQCPCDDGPRLRVSTECECSVVRCFHRQSKVGTPS